MTSRTSSFSNSGNRDKNDVGPTWQLVDARQFGSKLTLTSLLRFEHRKFCLRKSLLSVPEKKPFTISSLMSIAGRVPQQSEGLLSLDNRHASFNNPKRSDQ